MNLVNKDQLDILSTLRESVNEDKAGLEADIERLNNRVKELNDKNRMQLEQVNGLLMEKVSLQSEGIGHREKLLQRERDFGFVASLLSILKLTTSQRFARFFIGQRYTSRYQGTFSRYARRGYRYEGTAEDCTR